MCQVRDGEDPNSLPPAALLKPCFFSLGQFFDPTVNMTKLQRGIQDYLNLVSSMLITQPPAKRIEFKLCLGERRAVGSRAYAQSMQTGQIHSMFAGGGNVTHMLPLVQRMRGIEEQTVELWGFEVDWAKSAIRLEGQVLSRSNWAAFVK